VIALSIGAQRRSDSRKGATAAAKPVTFVFGTKPSRAAFNLAEVESASAGFPGNGSPVREIA